MAIERKVLDKDTEARLRALVVEKMGEAEKALDIAHFACGELMQIDVELECKTLLNLLRVCQDKTRVPRWIPMGEGA